MFSTVFQLMKSATDEFPQKKILKDILNSEFCYRYDELVIGPRVVQFVYVIGLHAVQFGNNWIKKIPRTAKIGRGSRPRPIWKSEEFLESNYFQIGQACSPLTY